MGSLSDTQVWLVAVLVFGPMIVFRSFRQRLSLAQQFAGIGLWAVWVVSVMGVLVGTGFIKAPKKLASPESWNPSLNDAVRN